VRWFDRGSGSVQGSLVVGNHADRRLPPAEAGAWLQVLEDSVLVHHALPVPTTQGGQARTTHLRRRQGVQGAGHLSVYSLLDVHGPVIPTLQGWIGLVEDLGGETFLARVDGDRTVQPLALENHHPEFLESARFPVRAGKVAYLGTRAVDLASLRIRWQASVGAGGFRMVPARGTALSVRDLQTVVALRSHREQRSRPGWNHLPQATEPTRVAARAVLRDGAVDPGPFLLHAASDSDRRVLQPVGNRGKKLQWHLEELLALELAEGPIAYCPTTTDLLRGMDYLVHHDLAHQYTELAFRARSAGSPELLQELIQQALRAGSDDWLKLGKAEDSLNELQDLKRRGRGLRIKQKLVDSLREQQRQLQRHSADWFWNHVMKLPAEASAEVRIGLLRRILAVNPEHPGVRAAILQLLPVSLRPPDPFQSQEWLEFLAAIQHTPVSVVEGEIEGNSGWSEQQLSRLRDSWREDLIAIESAQLLVVTPLQSPGRIARCLALGELICATLEGFFAAGKHVREKRRPLLLLLYETQEEYNRESSNLSGFVEWTAGHYSPNEKLSRLFLPADGDAFAEVQSVFAHELTHHWIFERCPLFTEQELKELGHETPGFWIVEGFATLIESLQFDLWGQRYSSQPLSDSLDIVANAEARSFVPWHLLVRMTQGDFFRLNKEAHLSVPLSQYLGLEREMSQARMFYDQSAAICEYLFEADQGRHRPVLIEYVGNYHRDRRSRLDFESAFGIDPKELGKRVIDFARQRWEERSRASSSD
jgi:hypothetical protein